MIDAENQEPDFSSFDVDAEILLHERTEEMKIRDWAKGRWPQIISTLLGPQYTATRRGGPCPKGQGTDRYRFSDIHDTGNFFCACSNGDNDGFDLLMCVKGWDFKTAAAEVEKVIGKCPRDPSDYAPRKETWAEKLQAEVVATQKSIYLANRGLEVAPALRWHHALPYSSHGTILGRYPAMMAPVTRAGKFLTYHVTYILGGAKAPVEKVRKMLTPVGPIKGGACELYEPRDGWIGVAEGIETAIAAKMLFNVPTWATLSANLMAGWEPPRGVEHVVIFGDRDKSYTGQAAAFALAKRLKAKGLDVGIKMPAKFGTDFNDELLAKNAT